MSDVIQFDPQLGRCCRDTVAYHLVRGHAANEGTEYGCHWCQDSVKLDPDGVWRAVRSEYFPMQQSLKQVKP